MPPQIHTTDRFNMAERIQVGVSLCLTLSDVFRIFNTGCYTSDNQRIEEIT